MSRIDVSFKCAGILKNGSTKAAVVCPTESVAADNARQGIRMNAVSPGLILMVRHDRFPTAQRLERSMAGSTCTERNLTAQ